MYIKEFNIRQNDLSPAIQFALLPTSVVLTGASVVFSMKNVDTGEVKISREAAIIVTETVTPTVKYNWQVGDTDTPGLYKAEFEVTYSDATVETFPNDLENISVRVTEEIA